MKSKSQTDAEIKASASVDDNSISYINVRNSESTHPIDCSCDYCKQLKFGDKDKKEVLNNLQWDLT